MALALTWAASGRADILWSDLGATLVHDSGPGRDILGGALKRDDTSTDTLYFKFHVDPLSDVGTEEYFAGFQLYEGDAERLGIGNSLKAWAYSAFNTSGSGELNKVFGDMDLRSSRPAETEVAGVFLPYELPRRGIERTIVFKVEYVAGDADRITVWLNPDLGAGATEAGQPENLTTHFTANASFDQLRLRHGGGGAGWTFSDMAIATSFSDFVGVVNPAALPFTFRAWQREQGLPQSAILALSQTRDGYLWLGSDDGLTRFDGVRFVSFGLREGLKSGRVRRLLEDSHGALWVGTEGGGLTRWKSGEFETWTVKDGLLSDSITALVEERDGRIWAGTESGLSVWDKGHVSEVSGASQFRGRTITALFKDFHGTMWVGVAGLGIFQFVGGKFNQVSEATVTELLRDPHCLLLDTAGRLWVGAGDDFVLCRESGEWRRYRIARHLVRPYVSTLTEDPDHAIWAGSVSEGLLQFKEGKLVQINASSGLSDNVVEAIFADGEGDIWVGTGSGLNRIRRKSLLAFGPNEGLGYGPVQGMAEVGPGMIWVGKPGDGLFRWDGRMFERLPVPGMTRDELQINSLLLTRDGSCWVGEAQGLLRFSDPRTSADKMERVEQLAGRNVLSLLQTDDGALWAGTREGQVWRFKDKTWQVQTNETQTHAITAMAQDKSGGLWIGTEGGGLTCFKDGQPTHIQKRAGLLSELIRALYADASGAVWIGTSGGGLSVWRPDRTTTFTTQEGLPDNTISQILEDNQQQLWLGSNRGLACVRKRELDDRTPGRGAAFYPQLYGQGDGMMSEECSGGFSPAGLKTSSGQFWFPCLKGIVAADPAARAAQAPPPAVVLEELLVDGVPLEGKSYVAPPTDTPIRIPPGKRRFEFRYTGMSFSAPERVRFRYRLEPLDSDWVEAGMQRVAYYPFLPPGDYRFRVIACNRDGVWNERGAGVSIKALPYLWQARWFQALGAVLLGVGVAGVARLAEKRKLHRQLAHLEQERALERERSRIAQDLHDDLGSSLTRISLLSDLVKADKDTPGHVEAHAQKLSQSAAHTVRALEEIVWALRPGSDSLQSLIEYIAHFANELYQGDSARCRLDLPNDLPARRLPPEMRHNIFLVVKEALTNALKHARAKEVRVQARASPDSLEITVQDDGRGFDPLAGGAANGTRQGLGNMRRRAEAMHGSLAVESASGKGTTVRLNVSLRNGGA